MGTANGMEHPLWYTLALIYDEKDMKHMCKAQLLSLSTL